MSKCPICNATLTKDKREIEPGVFAEVEVCPKCSDEWIDENQYKRLYDIFRRRAFKVGGSIAVRIPKEIANVVKIHEGDELKFSVVKKKIIIEPT